MTRRSRTYTADAGDDVAVKASAQAFYVEALAALVRSRIPFLVGGGFAYAEYLDIEPNAKDVDVLIRPEDVPRTLEFFRRQGYLAELLFPHWLGKVRDGEGVIDVIFSSGNGVARVDDRWFEHAVPEDILGMRLSLCPPEEMIWSKAFVQERERFDGADVLHLFRALGPRLDWPRILERFDVHWRVLLSHIVLFGFVYPDQRDQIPAWVWTELTKRFVFEGPDRGNPLCNGTLLSREQYRDDLARYGYVDARAQPAGPMTGEEIAAWTAAIGR